MNTVPDQVAVEEGRLLQALEIEPTNSDLLLRLGCVRLQRGDSLGAREALLKAHVLRPDSIAIRIFAAMAMAHCRDYRAPQMITDWRKWLPLPDMLQYNLADVMQRTDWTGESVGVLQDLLRRSPQHRWGRILLAAMYERVNRIEDATAIVDAMLEEGLEEDPNARNELVHQKAGLLARGGDVPSARSLMEQAAPRYDGDDKHFFTLARFADRMDDANAAMEYLGTAHALQRRELEQVAPQRLADAASLLPAASGRLEADDLARWPELAAPDAAHSPVFVVGFPRSGTTLMEQMLDAHPALQAMDERPHFDILADQLDAYGVRVPQDLCKLSQADCDELRKGYLTMACAKIERRWDARLVDKNPLNMLWLPLMYRMFPDARYVLMLRHPCDVLLSNYMQRYRSAVMMSASLDLQRLAQAYVEAFTHWFHHASMLEPTVMKVRYEDLVAQPAKQVAALGGFLGLDDPSAMLRVAEHAREKGFIGTPSYTQVTEPIHDKGVGRWLRYRAWFDDALKILAPVLPEVGYTIGEDV